MLFVYAKGYPAGNNQGAFYAYGLQSGVFLFKLSGQEYGDLYGNIVLPASASMLFIGAFASPNCTDK